MKCYVYVLSALMTLISQSGYAVDSEQWELKKDKNGIQIYTGSVPGSPFKAVRGVTVMKTSLSSLVALVLDTEACPQWADLCAKSRVHESMSDTESYVYTRNNLPWPVSDRDVLAHVVWSQNPETFMVTMQSKATTGLLDKKKKVVRLTEANAQWFFRPLGDGQVEVVTQAHVNPGGPLPAWVTNLLLVDSPFNTLSKMKEAVKGSKYTQAEVSFIKNRNTDAEKE